MHDKPPPRRIVLIGGGTGSPRLLLALRRKSSAAFSMIVPVTDTGRSTGAVRRALGMPAPGDIRHCLTILAGSGSRWGRLLELRLSAPDDPDLDGMAVGNLVLAALTQRKGDIGSAARALAAMLDLPDVVLPVSLENIHLAARLADGREVSGEYEVRRPGKAAIEEVHISGGANAISPAAQAALAPAEVIILGPGSLWTSLGAVLAVGGVREAIQSSGGFIIFVCNTTTQPGQTDELDCTAHVEMIAKMLGRCPDVVVANSARLGAASESALAAEGLHLLLPDAAMTERLKSRGIELITGAFLSPEEPTRLWAKLHTAYHDMDALARVILDTMGRQV